MSVVHKVAELLPTSERCEKLKLLVEIGTRDLSLLWFSGKGPEIHGLHLSYCDEPMAAEEIGKALKNLLQSNEVFSAKTASVRIFINTPESVLIPAEYVDKNIANSSLDLMYGEAFDAEYLMEELKEGGFTVCSRFPELISKELKNVFPDAKIGHVHAALISKENVRLDLLTCSVHPDYLMVSLFTGQQLRIFRQIDYRTPEDAAYQLLSICQQYAVSAEHIKVRLDGLLDNDSLLFKELHKYFGNLTMAHDPMVDLSNVEELKSLPPHYYFKLIRLSACE